MLPGESWGDHKTVGDLAVSRAPLPQTDGEFRSPEIAPNSRVPSITCPITCPGWRS